MNPYQDLEVIRTLLNKDKFPILFHLRKLYFRNVIFDYLFINSFLELFLYINIYSNIKPIYYDILLRSAKKSDCSACCSRT